MTATREQDLRLEILNTLLTTPHRRLDQIWPVHRDLIQRDPLFYVRLGAWYQDHGDVRDHKEMFVVALAQSDFDGHRDVGLAMLRELPPYQVVRVIDFIHGRKKTRKVRTEDKTSIKKGRLFKKAAAPPKIEIKTEEFGLFRNVPRSMKTEIVRYLREREAEADWFDSSVLMARKAVKRLYAVLHVKPGERAQKILFDKDPPKDSRLFALKRLAGAQSPAKQAAAIVEHRIPYRVAATVIKQMTPTVMLALIERMSPQDLINNLGSLKRRGAFDNNDVKLAIEAKLEEAKTDNRVAAFKAEEAVKAAGVSDEVQQKLQDVASTQVKARGRITRPTALLVDKSASMSTAIELGKRIGSMISTVCEKNLFAYAFDTMAYEISPNGEELADWEKAFAGIQAGGCTSCGVPLSYMQRKKQYVEQIIMITDEQENSAPFFVDALKQYREATMADPAICLVRTPHATDQLQKQCQQQGMIVDVFQFTGDYYSLPNLIPMLTRPSKMELLMEIMDYPLPQRKSA